MNIEGMDGYGLRRCRPRLRRVRRPVSLDGARPEVRQREGLFTTPTLPAMPRADSRAAARPGPRGGEARLARPARSGRDDGGPATDGRKDGPMPRQLSLFEPPAHLVPNDRTTTTKWIATNADHD